MNQQQAPMHWVSASCEGEKCGICWRAGAVGTLAAPATHKVGEEIFHDDPNQMRHNFTQYVCCSHFKQIFGSAVSCNREETMGKSEPEIVGKPLSAAVTGSGFQSAPAIDVDHLFTYHAPTGDQPQRYSSIREAARVFAHVILLNTKPGADQSAAIRLLREAVMTANSAIALEK
jgi:hypothetical protein